MAFAGFPNTHAQDNKPEPNGQENVQDLRIRNLEIHPVVYGKKNDGLPRSMTVRGVVEEVTFSPTGCGLAHWYGTVKIRLQEKFEGYKPDYVYVVASCFFTTHISADRIRQKVIEFELSKLGKGTIEYAIFNTIDSSGVAFYNLLGAKIAHEKTGH